MGLYDGERERKEGRETDRETRQEGGWDEGKKNECHDLRNIPLSAALLHYQANVLFPEVMLTLNEAFLICRSDPRLPAPLSCEGNRHRGVSKAAQSLAGDFLPL